MWNIWNPFEIFVKIWKPCILLLSLHNQALLCVGLSHKKMIKYIKVWGCNMTSYVKLPGVWKKLYHKPNPKQIKAYSDGSLVQWSLLRRYTGPSQHHSFRLHLCSCMFLRSRLPIVLCHRLQQKMHTFYNPPKSFWMFTTCVFVSFTCSAVVSSPSRSTGTLSIHWVTVSIVLTSTFHLAPQTETSSRACYIGKKIYI